MQSLGGAERCRSSVRQENLEKQLEENKMELDKELLKQKKICSVLEKDISVAYTAEVTSPCLSTCRKSV